ncbi:MAG: LD-carboxypeptidase [Cyclobacteriaceae bacterium]|nr:LD-carboxypeptidase [Cyclobacteriaceae bacterium]
MIVPEFLKPGNEVGVVATAKKVNKEKTLLGIKILESWGLQVVVGKNVFNSFHQFAGTDEQRIEDFQQMISDPKIKAIFILRGGYGSTRIIDQINFSPLKTDPKWICGFSDVTAIHLHLNNLGIASIHSPMPSFFYAIDQKSLHWFKDLIFGKKPKCIINNHKLNRQGVATGKLTGGNLSIICHTIGTKSEIATRDHILFMEDVGEQLYHLDRMMVQLKRAGILKDLAGLIVGQFSDMKDNEDVFGYDANEIIYSHTKEFDYPIAFNFPIGHTNENYAIPVGLEAKLKVNHKGSAFDLG